MHHETAAEKKVRFYRRPWFIFVCLIFFAAFFTLIYSNSKFKPDEVEAFPAPQEENVGLTEEPAEETAKKADEDDREENLQADKEELYVELNSVTYSKDDNVLTVIAETNLADGIYVYVDISNDDYYYYGEDFVTDGEIRIQIEPTFYPEFVVNGTYDMEYDNQTAIRLAVTEDEFFGYHFDDVIFVHYYGYTDFIDEDIVTIYGTITGTCTYESAAGLMIELPAVMADMIE